MVQAHLQALQNSVPLGLASDLSHSKKQAQMLCKQQIRCSWAWPWQACTCLICQSMASGISSSLLSPSTSSPSSLSSFLLMFLTYRSCHNAYRHAQIYLCPLWWWRKKAILANACHTSLRLALAVYGADRICAAVCLNYLCVCGILACLGFLFWRVYTATNRTSFTVNVLYKPQIPIWTHLQSKAVQAFHCLCRAK